MVVGYVGTSIPQPVVEHQTHLAGERDRPLAFPLVLNRHPGVWPVPNLQALPLRVVVLDVQRVSRSDPHYRMPEEQDRHVAARRVLVSFEVLQHRLGVEHHLSGVLVRGDVRRADLDVEILFDAVDRLQPPDEDAQRVQLSILTDHREIAIDPPLGEVLLVLSSRISPRGRLLTIRMNY